MQAKKNDMPVLLVTGASGGLGKTVIDYYLQKKQFRVVACSRTTMEYQNELFQHISLDLTQETSAPQLSKTIQDQYGRLDFIINCIGISHSKLLYFTGSKDISSVYQTNVFAPFSVIKECSKIMIKNGGGKIINLSTIHVDLTTAGTSIYGSSKAALELITKVLAKEFSSNKIQINCLRLSAVENTGMTNTLTEVGKKQLIENTASKREVKISEFLEQVDFLFSERSEGMSGQIIVLGDA